MIITTYGTTSFAFLWKADKWK